MRKITLRLANGRVVEDAVATLHRKFERFAWAWYDGVATDPECISVVDFAITIAMNSRATAGRLKDFMSRGIEIERLLRAIPVTADLSRETTPAVFAAVRDLFAEACLAKGTALSVASKVLHRKRPGLIPMLDRIVVERHYWPALVGLSKASTPPAWFERHWLKHGAWSDPTMYMRLMAGELESNRSELAHIRERLDPTIVPRGISDVRLLEAALYGTLVAT